MKLLCGVAPILWVFFVSAQEAWPAGKILADAIPPTRVITSPPSAISSKSSPSATLPADGQPSIIWHQAHGRLHWHCVANCSKFRSRHENLGDEGNEPYDSSDY
jgi:hypothetical protein